MKTKRNKGRVHKNWGTGTNILWMKTDELTKTSSFWFYGHWHPSELHYLHLQDRKQVHSANYLQCPPTVIQFTKTKKNKTEMTGPRHSSVSYGGATGAAQTPSGAHEERKNNKCEWNCWWMVRKVTMSGLEACQSWWLASHHLSAVSAAEHRGPSRCMSLPPGRESSYHNIANNSQGDCLFQSLNRPGIYLGPNGNRGQEFNSFLSKIRDESVTNFARLSVNSLASFRKWSCCGGVKDSANQHSRQTPHLCCHSWWHTFVSPSPWSFCGTLSRGVLICW